MHNLVTKNIFFYVQVLDTNKSVLVYLPEIEIFSAFNSLSTIDDSDLWYTCFA